MFPAESELELKESSSVNETIHHRNRVARASCCTLQALVDLVVDVRQVGGELEEDFNHSEDHSAVWGAKLLLQNVLRREEDSQ